MFKKINKIIFLSNNSKIQIYMKSNLIQFKDNIIY